MPFCEGGLCEDARRDARRASALLELAIVSRVLLSWERDVSSKFSGDIPSSFATSFRLTISDLTSSASRSKVAIFRSSPSVVPSSSSLESSYSSPPASAFFFRRLDTR